MFEQIDDDIIIPVVWLNESAIVGQEDADMLYGWGMMCYSNTKLQAFHAKQ